MKKTNLLRAMPIFAVLGCTDNDTGVSNEKQKEDLASGGLPICVTNPVGGTYLKNLFEDSVNVSISCPTAGAEIRYSFDRNPPTRQDSLYKPGQILTLKSDDFKNDIQLRIRSWFGSDSSPTLLSVYKFGLPLNVEIDTSHIIDGRDGKTYKTAKFFGKTWLAENVRFAASGSWLYTKNGVVDTTYGRLYSWHVAMALPDSCETKQCREMIKSVHQGICPDNWHIPTIKEWFSIYDSLSLFSGINKWRTKEALCSKTGWMPQGVYQVVGSDIFGFNAKPSGIRFPDDICRNTFSDCIEPYYFIGTSAYWWLAYEYSTYGMSSSENTPTGKYAAMAGVSGKWIGGDHRIVTEKTNGIDDAYDKRYGLSVRCVKN